MSSSDGVSRPPEYLFELRPNAVNSVHEIHVGIFDLTMNGTNKSQPATLCNDFQREYQSLFNNFPWSRSSPNIVPITNIYFESGIYIHFRVGWSIADIQLIQRIVIDFCKTNVNLFYTIKVDGSDLLRIENEEDGQSSDKDQYDAKYDSGLEYELDFESKLESASDRFEKLHWNRNWGNTKYIYQIPLTYMPNQTLDITSALSYLNKRNLVSLKRIKMPKLVPSLKKIVSNFYFVPVIITKSMHNLIKMNSWIIRASLIDDYFLQELESTDPNFNSLEVNPIITFPGSRLARFENLDSCYILSNLDGPLDSDEIEVELCLDELSASLLQMAPFEHINARIKGVLLTNTIELFLQRNKKLGIAESDVINHADVSEELEVVNRNWLSFQREMCQNNLKKSTPLKPVLYTADQENYDFSSSDRIVYSAEEANLSRYLRNESMDSDPPVPATVIADGMNTDTEYKHYDPTQLAEFWQDVLDDGLGDENLSANEIAQEYLRQEGSTISEDDFFEFFCREALKLKEKEIETLCQSLNDVTINKC
ncbi:hypothetical protein DAMA08_004380 [Martiniozyma asiatica (nom. inval.)]|nr:hypothetical protein DAMA08_004380 [Martiniozyma asiatica]